MKKNQYLMLLLASAFISTPVWADEVIETAAVVPAEEVAVVTPDAVVAETLPAEEVVVDEVVVDAKATKTIDKSASLDAATLEQVPGLNATGLVSKLSLGKDKEGHDYLEIEVRDGHLDGYQTTPKQGRAFMSVPQEVAYLADRPLSHFAVNLNADASNKTSYFKPSSVQKINDTTFRLGVPDAETLKKVKAFVSEHPTGRPFQAVLVDILNFASVTGKAGKAVPYADREDFRVFANGGVESDQIAEGKWRFSFKDVTPSALTEPGVVKAMTPETFIETMKSKETLANGKTVPFAPNGRVVMYDEKGNPTLVIMSFSNFTFDSKTSVLTAEAEPLRALWSSDEVESKAIISSKPVKSPHAATFVLDYNPPIHGVAI